MFSDPTADTRDLGGRIHDGVGAIVLVEGLDATGKSTLIGRLYNRLRPPVAVFHAGPPTFTTALREYVWPLGIAAGGYVVICDRWHLGEMVWPYVFDRMPLLETIDDLRGIEEQIRYLRTPILPLYMNRAFRQIEMELEYRGDGTEHLEKAAVYYDTAIKASSFTWQNTTLHDAEELVIGWLDEQRQ